MADAQTIETRCSECGSRYRVAARFIGQSVTCQKCRKPFTVRAQEPATPYPVLGRLAISYRFISEGNLKSALDFQQNQAREGVTQTLASILVSRKLLTPRQVDQLEAARQFLEARQLDKRFGRLAVERGYATAENVDAALEQQTREFNERHISRLLGDILVEAGALTAKERDLILAEQHRLDQHFPELADIADSSPEGPPPEAGEAGPEITVTPDGLSAYLILGAGGAEAVSLESVKALLTRHGVVAGVVADEAIAAFLEKSPPPGKRFKLAVGRPPVPGQDGVVHYFFEADFRRIGAVTPQGTMDYRDRGEIPHVKSGDLIAERRPGKPGSPGEDVYGQPVPAPEVREARLRCGRGVRVADNGCKFFALNDGQPKLTVAGKLMVVSSLTIPGDVDLKVGHVEFDGTIRVDGTIREGFNVTGAGLSAMEIYGATVKINGDVTVTGGIIGARVVAQGDLKARYIKNSKISVFGNVLVEKEIIESEIETSGACKVLKGAIVSSEISARYGIEAFAVGTEVSRPCTLRSGSEQHIEREISGLRKAIARAKERLAGLCSEQAALEPAYQENHRQIAEFAQIQDRAMLAQRELKADLERLQRDQDDAGLNAKRREIEALDARARQAETTLSELFEKQEQIEGRRSGLQAAISEVESEIQDLHDERDAILAWARQRKGVPVVVVGGEILGGTRIYGVHSSAVLKSRYRHVRIREVKRVDPAAGESWELRIQPAGG